jgi:RNA-directed DNA polymerase
MAKRVSKSAATGLECRRSLVNTDELEQVMVREAQLHALAVAERRVLEIQTKLHRWAGDDPHRRFDDLFNLVADPAFLLVAWDRVRNNRGARTAGVDGETAYYVETVRGLDSFLGELRGELKARTFQPPSTRTQRGSCSGRSATTSPAPPAPWRACSTPVRPRPRSELT